MKKSENRKRGFSLVELLITIGIIGVILTISSISVYTIINNSKGNNNEITIHNIKAISEIYIKEYASEISWNEDNTTCIPIQTLISKGYIKKEVLNNSTTPFSIILTRNEYNIIISEREEYIDCDTYSRTVSIPTNEDICNNIPYDGDNHFLINQSIPMNNYSSIEYLDNKYKNTNNISDHPKNADEYKVSVNLAEGKKWEDNTNVPKTVTCKINKRIPDLKLNSTGNSDTQIGTKEIILTSEVNGTVSIKSSNNNYVTAKVKDNNVITANTDKTIEITTIASRNSTTTVTITVTPTGEYKNNYEKASITYTVGNVNTITVIKPTPNESCNDLIYNGKSQTLAKTNEAYTLVNNSAIEIGNYTVTARLKYGYVWNDNTTDNVEFSCEIQTPKPKVTYKDADCNPSFIDVSYNKPYGENQSLCTPIRTGYTFNGWYSDSNYSNRVTNDTVVTNFNNHNLYAKWSINTYKVTFDPIEGKVSQKDKDVTYNSTYGTLPTPTYEEYTFLGWYTEKNGGDKITSSTKVEITGDQTLYAHWVKTSTSFEYTGNIQKFPVEVTGKYKLEVWGAQGGSINGGKGGYSTGFVSLSANTTLYIVVGNQPANFSGQGGYNGGGAGGSEGYNRGGGGGATHISKTETLLKDTSVENLYIVAGGGGGGTYLEGGYKTSATGGAGGGTTGGTGGNSGANIGTCKDCFEKLATGGSQTSGGTGGIGRDFDNHVYSGKHGSKGQGGNGDPWRPGGGGGYYGGGSAGVSSNYTSGGGGGSGYIGGVTDGSMENGIQSENGKATITFIE